MPVPIKFSRFKTADTATSSVRLYTEPGIISGSGSIAINTKTFTPEELRSSQYEVRALELNVTALTAGGSHNISFLVNGINLYSEALTTTAETYTFTYIISDPNSNIVIDVRIASGANNVDTTDFIIDGLVAMQV